MTGRARGRRRRADGRENEGDEKVPAKSGRSLNDVIYGSEVKDSNVSIREKAEQ